jgi:hypothetical protein
MASITLAFRFTTLLMARTIPSGFECWKMKSGFFDGGFLRSPLKQKPLTPDWLCCSL